MQRSGGRGAAMASRNTCTAAPLSSAPAVRPAAPPGAHPADLQDLVHLLGGVEEQLRAVLHVAAVQLLRLGVQRPQLVALGVGAPRVVHESSEHRAALHQRHATGKQPPWAHSPSWVPHLTPRHSLDVEGPQNDGQALAQPLQRELAGAVHGIEGHPWGRVAAESCVSPPAAPQAAPCPPCSPPTLLDTRMRPVRRRFMAGRKA